MIIKYDNVSTHAATVKPPMLGGVSPIDQSMALHGIAEAFAVARDWQQHAAIYSAEKEQRLTVKAMENLAAAYHGLLVACELSANVSNPEHPCTLEARK